MFKSHIKYKSKHAIGKQAIEVIFSHKKDKPVHPPLSFNGIPVKRESHTEHLGVILDERLNFRLHIQEKIKKANKGLGLLKFLSSPRAQFLTKCTRHTSDHT